MSKVSKHIPESYMKGFWDRVCQLERIYKSLVQLESPIGTRDATVSIGKLPDVTIKDVTSTQPSQTCPTKA
jgi:hypothetical protein